MPLRLILKAWPVFAVLAFVIVAKLVLNSYNDAQQEVAKSETIIEAQEEVLDATARTNEARNDVLDPTKYTKYCQCLRSTSTPGVCERYLPANSQNTDKPSSMCETR